jgi:hypothetical protein
MTALLVTGVVVLFAIVLTRRRRASAPTPEPAPKPKPKPKPRRGWLDDDGLRRGERWDGSWFSGPRTALSLA